MDSVTRVQYLNAMGIDVWVEREDDGDVVAPVGVVEDSRPMPESQARAPKAAAPIAENPVAETLTLPNAGKIAEMGWDDLEASVSRCTACSLHEKRTQTVFGVGDHDADWLIIGEAPGVDEDAQGEPFVGRSGKLLDKMIAAVGLRREQVFIANILKCRPPNNRDPRAEEVACCEAYLKRQIELLQPKVILALGKVAAHNLLKITDKVGQMRGKRYEYAGIPVIVTYHPAYLLRSPEQKARSWDDLKLAMKIHSESS